MIKAVIFDMDGVIVDTEPLNKLCLQEFLHTLGIANPPAPTGTIQGLNSKAYWTIIKKFYGLELPVEELAQRWRPYYLAYLASLEQLPTIPGVLELVAYLAANNYQTAIASSANPIRIKLILDKINLEHSFSIIVDGDSYKESKPAPDCFLLAAERLGIPREECIVIEDSTNGVRAAKAAQIRCVGYAGSDHNTDDLSEADVVITDFMSLIASLQSDDLFPV
jgi:HAD superfamily hydrolase (TIGR01509 family)